MADSPEDRQGDSPEAAKPETEPAAEPEGAATAEKPEAAEPEATPEEKAKLDVSEASLDELLKREDIQRAIQSASDRAAAKTERRFADEQKQREAQARQRQEAEEERKLRDEQDYEGLGRRYADKSEAEERLMESLRAAGDIIGGVTRERYARELGEETVERIRSEIESRGGHLVDFQEALANERQNRAVEKASTDAASKVRDEFKEDMEALRAELGVKTRSEAAAKGEGPVEGVSKGAPKPQTEEEETYESMSKKYGEGEVSYAEFAPYKAAHDKERKK